MAPHIDRLRVRQSLIAVPSLYVAGAILLGIVAPHVDGLRDGGTANVETARDLLTATATGMIAFTGRPLGRARRRAVRGGLLYSPRLVLWFRRDKLIKHAIGIFLAAFVFALVALRRIDEPGSNVSPDVTVGVALLLLIGSCLLFLALSAAGHGPAAAAGALRRGHARGDPCHAPDLPGAARRGAGARPGRMGERLNPGLVPSPRPPGRGRPRSTATRCWPSRSGTGRRGSSRARAWGEYARPHRELLRVHGGPVPEPEALARHVHLAAERTIEQDPAFAMRIVVDTAIRALSPAVNDPTTGTQALDVLEVLVAELAVRDLQASPRAPRRRRGWSGSCGTRRPGTTCSTSRSTRSAATGRVPSRSPGGCGRAGGPPRRDAARTPRGAPRAPGAARRRRAHGVPGWVAGSLTSRGFRIGWASVSDERERERLVNEHGERARADERRRRRGPHVPGLDADRRDRHDERQLRRGEQRLERLALGEREHAAVEQQGRQPADEQEQPQEDGQLDHRPCARHERLEVELDPAGHEEDGDQQPEADRVELGLELLRLAALQQQPQDAACRERAEDHVEPEVGGDHDQAEEQQHGEPQRGPGRSSPCCSR